MCVRRTRVWVCICAHFGFVDSFLFLLHRISCYLLHFQINSVAVGLQFSFADWTHCQCQTENEFFGSYTKLHTLYTLLLMLLNWNWSVNYSVGFWFLTHTRSAPRVDSASVERSREQAKKTQRKRMSTKEPAMKIALYNFLVEYHIIWNRLCVLTYNYSYCSLFHFITLCCPLCQTNAKHQISRMNLNFGPCVFFLSHLAVILNI